MPQILKPRDAKDVQDAVAWALSEGVAIEIVGHGSKRSIGRLSPTDIVLDLSALRGITLYESNELVFSAQAGTPIVEIAETLARENQQLAFEVPDYGPLLGGADGRGTIGGLIAANLSGPRRIKAGALRDHFLGVSAVSGRGELFKSGGRVIKNVTGYDLCKLLAGSWGTLAVMTEVTLKVLPRAETETTLLLRGLSDAKAAAAMAAAMASMGDVSGAAHLPARMAARSAALDGDGQAVTALRLEGIAAAMAQRKRLLDAALASFGAVAELGERASRALWREIRDVQPLAAAASERALWRVSTAPAQGHKAAAAIAVDGEVEFFYDWAGGLLWIALPAAEDGGAARVRQAVAGVGGHAMLVRAPEAVRTRIDAFEPQDAVAAALTRQVKLAFDPKGVLNPGRMYAGV